MEEYAPKRIEFKKFDGYNRSLGICITREAYGINKDYYLYANLWWWNFTLVFLRITNSKSS